jgi:hypothetical protein
MPAEEQRSVREPDAWIEKPIDLARLVATVRRLTRTTVEGGA